MTQLKGDRELENIVPLKQKALRINLNKHTYGTFAEIGAGQETVRHFFRAGGASGTLMEAIAAYGIGVPVVVVTGTGLPTDRLQEAYPDGVPDERLGRGVWYTSDPAEAAELACSLATGKGPR